MKITKTVIFLIVLLTSCILANAQGTISCTGNYAAVVSCLAAGQWGEVTSMTGWQNYLGGGKTILNQYPALPPGSDDSILAYMSKAAWNPQTHELFIYGGPHPDTPPVYYKSFVKWNADTNAWSGLSLPSDTNATTSGQHYYHWNTIDPVNQDFYTHEFSNSGSEFRAMKYHIPDGTWTTLIHNYPLNAYSTDNFEAFEYFPDKDMLTWMVSGGELVSGVWKGVITQFDKTTAGGQWQFTNGSDTNQSSPTVAQGSHLPMGVNYGISLYDHAHHLIIFGGGDPDFVTPTNVTAHRQLYTLDVNGNVTALPLAPIDLDSNGIDNNVVLSASDPVTGDIIIWFQDLTTCTITDPRYKFIYHLGDLSWTKTDVTTSEAFLFNIQEAHCSNPGTNRPLWSNVTTADPDNGVIIDVKLDADTTVRVLVYKYAEHKSFTEKCAMIGVLGCWPFDDPSELHYHWDSNNTSLNTALAGHTNYTISGFRNAGEGNSVAYNEFAAPGAANSIASIDTAIKFEGGGALKLPTPQYSLETVANFQDNFNKTLGYPNVKICSNITDCPLGNKVYIQFMARMSASMINDYVLECGLSTGSGCFAGDVQASQVNSGGATTGDKTLQCKTGSTINCSSGYPTGFCITTGNPSGCLNSHVGKQLYMYGGTNCIEGAYTISAVNSYYEVVLDRSPSTVGNQCTSSGSPYHATVLVQSVGNGAGGWKVGLALSNADSTFGNDQVQEIVLNDGNQQKGPQVYGRKGQDAPGSYQTVYPHWLADTWQEVSLEIIVGTINVADTEVKWWMDGTLVGDWTTATLQMNGSGNGIGLGQLNILPFQTQRDPFFQSSADGALHIDNLIVSTSPIPFNKDAGGSPTPPPSNTGTSSRAHLRP